MWYNRENKGLEEYNPPSILQRNMIFEDIEEEKVEETPETPEVEEETTEEETSEK